MNLANITTVLALLVGLIATLFDLKYRKIPNWLTFSALLIGVVLNLALDLNHWWEPFLGIAIGFIALFIPFSLGGIGAGDVKLLMALGAICGVKSIIATILLGAVAGGVISVLTFFMHFGFTKGLIRIQLSLKVLLDPALRHNLQDPKNSEKKLYIPYGLVIYIGLIINSSVNHWWG